MNDVDKGNQISKGAPESLEILEMILMVWMACELTWIIEANAAMFV